MAPKARCVEPLGPADRACSQLVSVSGSAQLASHLVTAPLDSIQKPTGSLNGHQAGNAPMASGGCSTGALSMWLADADAAGEAGRHLARQENLIGADSGLYNRSH